MKGVFIFCTLICIFSSQAIAAIGNANKSTLRSTIAPSPLKDSLSKIDFRKLSVKEYEKHTGKKLSLNEKIAFKIVQHRLERGKPLFKKPVSSNTGTMAMILGIIGLVLLFVPYAVIASIPLSILAIVLGNQAKKADPSDKKARAGVILGWVTLGLFVLFLTIALVLLVAFLAAFG